MNKKISLIGFSWLLISATLVSFNSSKAIAANRMQDAIAEAKALARGCQGSSSCTNCVEENVIPLVIRKYRIESRREISAISAAAKGKCN